MEIWGILTLGLILPVSVTDGGLQKGTPRAGVL